MLMFVMVDWLPGGCLPWNVLKTTRLLSCYLQIKNSKFSLLQFERYKEQGKDLKGMISYSVYQRFHACNVRVDRWSCEWRLRRTYPSLPLDHGSPLHSSISIQYHTINQRNNHSSTRKKKWLSKLTLILKTTSSVRCVDEVKRACPAVPIPVSYLVRPWAQRRQISIDVVG